VYYKDSKIRQGKLEKLLEQREAEIEVLKSDLARTQREKEIIHDKMLTIEKSMEKEREANLRLKTEFTEKSKTQAAAADALKVKASDLQTQLEATMAAEQVNLSYPSHIRSNILLALIILV